MARASTGGFESVVTRAGAASVERQLTVEAGDVVAEFTLTVTSDTAQVVEVVDRLPGNFAVDEVRFAVDHAPRCGTARADGVSFEALVEPGRGTTVVYRAVLQDPVDTGSIAVANESDPPHVDAVEPVSSGDDGTTWVDAGRRSDGSGEIEDPSVLFERTAEDPAVAPPWWVPDAESRSLTDEPGSPTTHADERRRDLAALADDVDENQVRLDALADRMAVLEAAAGESVATRTDVDGTIEELPAAVAEIESSMDALRERIEACERFRDGLTSALDSHRP